MSNISRILRKTQFISHRTTGRNLADFTSYYPGLNTSTNSRRENGNVSIIHLPQELFNTFYDLSKEATAKEMETVTYLFGHTKQLNGTTNVYITHLFVPDQSATANSSTVTNMNCLNEFSQQYNVKEFGWMHSHPLETCCLSSIDIHTQYTKQQCDQNYISIVFSAIDNAFGIFAITNNGFNIIKQCKLNPSVHHQHVSNDIYCNANHIEIDDRTLTVIDERMKLKQTTNRRKNNKLSQKTPKQIRHKKIMFKFSGKIDDHSGEPHKIPQYEVSAKIPRPSLLQLISNQNKRMNPTNNQVIINDTSISNNTQNMKMTGAAAIAKIKSKSGMVQAARGKNSHYLTNMLGLPKPKESIFSSKYRLFNSHVLKLHSSNIYAAGRKIWWYGLQHLY